MTLFKIFHFDHESAQIDDTLLKRPSYVPTSAWASFWDSAQKYNQNKDRGAAYVFKKDEQ